MAQKRELILSFDSSGSLVRFEIQFASSGHAATIGRNHKGDKMGIERLNELLKAHWCEPIPEHDDHRPEAIKGFIEAANPGLEVKLLI